LKLVTVSIRQRQADVEEPSLHLSPDGNSIVFISLSTLAGQIRVISLLDGSERDVEVRGWNSLNHIDWAADGKGWFSPVKWPWPLRFYTSTSAAIPRSCSASLVFSLRLGEFLLPTASIWPSFTPFPATTLGCWNRSDFVGRCGFPHRRF
jgi:hypothetical protein